MAKQEKTNAVRTLERFKIPYTLRDYTASGAVSGVDVAAALGEDPARAFKTLVTVGKSKSHYVFMIPVAEELDLKKAAAACGEKNVEMIRSKELLPLTGYVHGGCSPVGMKKPFPTFIHMTAQGFDTILFSAGRIGLQLECPLAGLQRVIPVTCADLTV